MKYIMSIELASEHGQMTLDYLCEFLHRDEFIGNGWSVTFIVDGAVEQTIDLSMNTDFRPQEPYKWLEVYARDRWGNRNELLDLINVIICRIDN